MYVSCICSEVSIIAHIMQCLQIRPYRSINNPRAAHAQRGVIVIGLCVGRSVGRSVSRQLCLSVCTFSLEPWVWWIPNVDMRVGTTGARHSKSMERHYRRTAHIRQRPKIICSYYTGCALIRGHQPTGMALHIQRRQKQHVHGK